MLISKGITFSNLPFPGNCTIVIVLLFVTAHVHAVVRDLTRMRAPRRHENIINFGAWHHGMARRQERNVRT